MFGMTNALIRDTIQTLKDSEKWNGEGSYLRGKSCIVVACFNLSVDRNNYTDVDHLKALRAIRRVIQSRYGLTRGALWDRSAQEYQADIIGFNDHPKTTHADVMSVLYQAEKNTRPFWRGRMST